MSKKIKLLVEIQNDFYDWIKNGFPDESDSRYMADVIKHGTPITEGDMISRSELIKAVEKGEGISWERHGKDDMCVRKKYIDNAPSVKPEDLERTGYWETPEPDYARDGTRLPIRVAICSECQKPNKLPVGRYCSECGSRNKE